MLFQIDCSNKKIKKTIELVMPSIIEQLGLKNSKKSVLISVNNECPVSGITVPMPGINSYFVGIKPSNRRGLPGAGEIVRTLSHEMTHVKQMAKGVLRPTKRGRVIGNMWGNYFYPDSTPYLDRPWEIQAYQMQELIMRRAIE